MNLWAIVLNGKIAVIGIVALFAIEAAERASCPGCWSSI